MRVPPDDDHPRTGLLLVISGSTAAGKTTIGREIAGRLDCAIHIDGDVIQDLVVSGSIRMEVPPPPGALDQLRLRFRAALAVANLYRDAGFDAILSDNLFGEEARRFLAVALDVHRSRSVHFVMLNPTIEAIRDRYCQRPGGGYTPTLTPQVLNQAVEQTIHVGLWLDTSHQTAEETALDILQQLGHAAVAPEELSPRTRLSQPSV